jgi:hypothetical protein
MAAMPPPTAPPAAPADGETVRALQSQLLRVGCGGPDMTANGTWDDESESALTLFNRFAKTSFTGPDEAAVAAVHGHAGLVCPLVCGPGMRAQGETCVAEAQKPPRTKKEVARPSSRHRESAERTPPRPPRERQTVRSHPEAASRDDEAPHLNAFEGSTSPISGPKGMKCHTLDEVGLAPRIVCY